MSTDNAIAALVAAELKRMRKNAKRLGLIASEPQQWAWVRFWSGVIDGFLVRVHVEEFQFMAADDGTPNNGYSWAVQCGHTSFASSTELVRTADEAELAALRAVPDAVARMEKRAEVTR